MNTASNPTLCLLLAAAMSLPFIAPHASASGTYRPTLIRSGSKGKIDITKYITGKKIFTGATALEARPQTTQLTAPKLKALQAALPQAVTRVIDLNDMAGKLTTIQMEALEYYIAIRFRIVLTPEKS